MGITHGSCAHGERCLSLVQTGATLRARPLSRKFREESAKSCTRLTVKRTRSFTFPRHRDTVIMTERGIRKSPLHLDCTGLGMQYKIITDTEQIPDFIDLEAFIRLRRLLSETFECHRDMSHLHQVLRHLTGPSISKCTCAREFIPRQRCSLRRHLRFQHRSISTSFLLFWPLLY